MLQSKILKTKKRLSNNPWLLAAVVISFMGLLTTMTFAMRAVSLSARYGVVEAEIPVMSSPIVDPALHHYREQPFLHLQDSTPTVIMTTDGFFFGDMAAFSEGFTKVTNKYIVPTEHGQHRVDKLLDDIEKWMTYRESRTRLRPNGVVVLVPAGDMPTNIVIQVIAGLKQSIYIDRVILGSGLI